MPHPDLISACAGGVTGSHNDSKIACETLAGDAPPASDHPDFPPESFFLSKDAEIDWIDRNAFIERKDSGKSGSLQYSTPLPSSSQRYCLTVKSKPSIIGLPKSQKAAYGEAKQHRRPPSIRLFPKRSQSITSSNSGRKSEEPSSPKVSCIGRVRSRRDRSLRKKNRQKQPDPVIKRSRSIKISHKTGFWSNFLSIFGSKAHKQLKDDEPGSEPAAARTLKKSKSLRKRRSLKKRNLPAAGSSPSSAADPPSLVAVKHFTSGRRSDAWAADLEVDGDKQVE